uniref:Uncharacterized protein n=1 Tax=Chromera velia CCMP2878 TaxID=1169474 RepID=A0A0G4I748_9ALVE|eukprot:Cvel_11562.t1-p1 / transcript=Cvel_11562.t1 / gene=Cvel_11562 / organism=Chromera_velia_CCMP2878 / gene_product=hypothetical protein / transcript_product=hypothetical protein / location=Cvel_scaffold730:59024-59752(-) / protein_length=243 / sequence_SO=supercontig / SO=protein_coding / is_pseudo=false
MWKGSCEKGGDGKWGNQDMSGSAQTTGWTMRGQGGAVLTPRHLVDVVRAGRDVLLERNEGTTALTAPLPDPVPQTSAGELGVGSPIILQVPKGKKVEERPQEGDKEGDEKEGREGGERTVERERKDGEERTSPTLQGGADTQLDEKWEEEVIDRFVRVFGQVQARYMKGVKEGKGGWMAKSLFEDHIMTAGLLAATIAAPAEEDSSLLLIVPLTPWIPSYFPEGAKGIETEEQLSHQVGVCVG